MTRRNILIILFILFAHWTNFAQCIEKAKIAYGGDWDFINFIHRCPTYNFAIDGDTSKKWNVLGDPIDIKQAPPEVLSLKQKVEKEIKEYSGEQFFSKIKFNSVEVVYADKLKHFMSMGRKDVTLKYGQAKYFFYYEFKPDSLSTYHIGIAVNKKENIISKFHFPSNAHYIPIAEKFDYCKLIDIGRKGKYKIDPIKDIKLEFDAETNRFYWLLTQDIINSKEGVNYFNQVQIDAADLNIIKNIRRSTRTIY